MKRMFNILKEILLIFLVFSVSFGSKGLILLRLYDYNLVGPDPYIFYQQMVELYQQGYINDYDPNRYYPLGAFYYNKNLVSYFGYFSLILISNLPGLLDILKIFGISPLAKEITWLAANFSIPLFFSISAIIFYLFTKKLFKDKILALISTIVFSITPLFTMRIVAFDTELGAMPFIVLSFFFYYLSINSKNEKNLIKKILLFSLTILGIIILYYFVKFVPDSDHLQTFSLLGLFLITLLLYPIFKPSKEYFYVLLVFSTVLARKGWGGWIIIPIIIGINEILRFLTGKDNKEIYIYNLFIPYFSLLEYRDILLRSFIEIHNLIIVAASLLYFIEPIFEKIKIVDAVSKKFSLFRNFDKKILNRLIIIFLGFIISIPILFKYVDSIIRPYTDRMITSVAEFQKFSGLGYLKNYSFIGMLFSFFGLSYILWNKKDKKNLFLSLLSSFLLFLSLFFIDNFLSLEWATAISWMIVFLLILPLIIFLHKDISEEDLFTISISLICLIVGKYIYRLAFFSGFSISLLFPTSIKWLEFLKKYEKKLIIEIFLNLILFFVAITTFNLLFKIYTATKIIAFPILIPVLIYIHFIIGNYILRTENFDLLKYLQYAILFLVIYGFYNNFGYITNYFLPIYFSGSEDHTIYSMLYLNHNSEKNSVIHFWWDYGYYGRVIANRTVWLSGDNAYSYWNHLMGRYGLSGNKFEESLELMYVHSVYDYKTFKILEMFNKNDIFYRYLYKELNFTEKELEIIKNIKIKLKDKWSNLLYKFNGSYESIKEFELNDEEKRVLEKIYYIKYLKPSYLYIDPTDIGKSYQFTRLGSNEMFDKHSWIVSFSSLIPERDIKQAIDGIRINIDDEYYYLLVGENRISYFGNFFLDENLYIDNEKIPRCIPDLNILDCGVVFRIDLIFSEPITEIKQLRRNLIEDKINPWNVINSTMYIFYRNKIYNLSLGCIYFDGILLEFDNAEYNGCLYIMPSLASNNKVLSISSALFISQKSRNYTWAKLYFFNKGEPYFRLVAYFYPNLINLKYYIPPMIYREVQPAKIWKINYPEDFDVPEEKYCLYLATNIEEINKCSEIYNLRKYNSIWEV